MGGSAPFPGNAFIALICFVERYNLQSGIAVSLMAIISRLAEFPKRVFFVFFAQFKEWMNLRIVRRAQFLFFPLQFAASCVKWRAGHCV